MSEWEDRLNGILSSPEQMGRIMELAKRLSGGSAGPSGDEAEDAPLSPPNGPGATEARFMQLAAKALGGKAAQDREKADLIRALKPFLREEHRHELDRAYELTRIIRTARLVFGEMKGDGGLV